MPLMASPTVVMPGHRAECETPGPRLRWFSRGTADDEAADPDTPAGPVRTLIQLREAARRRSSAQNSSMASDSRPAVPGSPETFAWTAR